MTSLASRLLDTEQKENILSQLKNELDEEITLRRDRTNNLGILIRLKQLEEQARHAKTYSLEKQLDCIFNIKKVVLGIGN